MVARGGGGPLRWGLEDFWVEEGEGEMNAVLRTRSELSFQFTETVCSWAHSSYSMYVDVTHYVGGNVLREAV